MPFFSKCDDCEGAQEMLDVRGCCCRPPWRHTGCVAFDDGTIFKESVLQQFAEGCESVILLFCRRLGLDNITIEHRSGLERCFSLPQFEGLASGNSGSSAHFFVATQGDTLLYLDPHITQPALESVDDVRGSAGSLRPSRLCPTDTTISLPPSSMLGIFSVFLKCRHSEFECCCPCSRAYYFHHCAASSALTLARLSVRQCSQFCAVHVS